MHISCFPGNRLLQSNKENYNDLPSLFLNVKLTSLDGTTASPYTDEYVFQIILCNVHPF